MVEKTKAVLFDRMISEACLKEKYFEIYTGTTTDKVAAFYKLMKDRKRLEKYYRHIEIWGDKNDV